MLWTVWTLSLSLQFRQYLQLTGPGVLWVWKLCGRLEYDFDITSEEESSSDKSGTILPSEIRQRNRDTDLPSKRNGSVDVSLRNVNSPQDRGSEPSKRYDRKKGKKGYGKNGYGNKERDLKHHPLAREPPHRGRKGKISAYYWYWIKHCIGST